MAIMDISIEGNAEKELDKIGKAADKTTKKVDGLKRSTGLLSSSVKGLASSLKVASVGIAVIGASMAAMLSKGVRINSQLDDMNKISGRLSETLKTTSTYFDAFVASMSKPFYTALNAGMKEVNRLIGEAAPKAIDAMWETMKSFAKSSVDAIGWVINKIIDLIKWINVGVKGLNMLWEAAGFVGNKTKSMWGSMLEKGQELGILSKDLGDIGENLQKIGEAGANANVSAIAELDAEVQSLEANANTAKSAVDKLGIVIKTAVDKTEKPDFSKMVKDIEKYGAAKVKAAKKTAKKIAKINKKSDKDKKKQMGKEAKDLKEWQQNAVDGWLNVGSEIASMIGEPFGQILDSIMNFFNKVNEAVKAYQAVQAAQNTASLATSVPASIAQAGAQGGWVGAAIMAAILAAFGIGTSIASAGGSTAAPKIRDLETRESESLVNAIDKIGDVQYKMLTYTKSMDEHLSRIANSFAGMENALIGAGFSIDEKYKGGMKNKTVNLHGSFLDLDTVKIGEELKNYGATIENEFEVTVRRWTGRTKTVFESQFQEIGEYIGSYMQDIITESVGTFKLTGEKLGIDASGIDGMELAFKTIDVTGKSAAEIVEAVRNSVSVQLDDIAITLFGKELEGYREGILGYYEKAVAIAVDFDQVTFQLGLFGLSLKDVLDPMGKVVNRAWHFSEAMITAAGGLDELQRGMDTYMESFFSEQEQYNMQLKVMGEAFKVIGVTMPKTNKEFRSLVEGLDLSTENGAKLYGELMTISGAFSDLTSSAVDFHEDMISRIEEAYSGSLNYMNSLEKAAALDGIAKSKFATGDTQGYFDTLYEQLGVSKSMSTSREGYALNFDAYISELKGAEYNPKTTDDVVESLEEILEQNRRIEDAISGASYQAPLSNSYVGV